MAMTGGGGGEDDKGEKEELIFFFWCYAGHQTLPVGDRRPHQMYLSAQL
jgi:hypothetical protein